jgi:hypothetical protein
VIRGLAGYVDRDSPRWPARLRLGHPPGDVGLTEALSGVAWMASLCIRDANAYPALTRTNALKTVARDERASTSSGLARADGTL